MTAQKKKIPLKKNSQGLQYMLMQAGNLFAQGQLQQAEELLREVLQNQPRNADAWHLLGMIAHQVGQIDQALDLTGKAVALNDRVPLFHSNRAEICRQAGRVESAVAHGKKAVQLAPGMAAAHCNLGLAWYSKGEAQKARGCQQKALSLDPGLPAALNNLGSIHLDEYDAGAALDCFRRAIDADPYYLEAQSNLGAALALDERFEEAAVALSNALAIDDSYAEAHYNMGVVNKNLQKLEEGYAHFEKALQLDSEYTEAYVGLGQILLERNQLNDAEQMALTALDLDEGNIEAILLAGAVAVENDQPEVAVSYYDKALGIDPQCSDALNSKGNLCVEMGDFWEAEKLFNESIAVSPREDVAGRFHLSQIRKATLEDENIVALLDWEKDLTSFSERRRTPVHFSLGKIYDDLGEYKKASDHFLKGNDLKRKYLSSGMGIQDRSFDAIIETFEEKFLSSLLSGGISSELPVFVLGMPRSGTTLVEQILASHPDIHGAGELKEMPNILHRCLTKDGKEFSFPENLKVLTPEAVALWANDYLSFLKKKNTQSKRVTDKMPGNFLFLGLIRSMFPGARIVHVKRNPVDTCLSCFTHLFQNGHEYSYDLLELGRYYSRYEELMGHWQTVLPEGSYYTIEYEALVEDTESQAKRLVEYCGLEWDPGCLDFYRYKRKVRTASVTQVRKPIYQSSIERWRNYSVMLAPLIKVLGNSAS